MKMTEELLKYFKGDELAANVWLSKYAQEGEITPDDMHKRMAKEFARIEEKYITEEDYIKSDKENLNLLSLYGQTRKYLFEEDIYNLFKDFKYIIPQGSIMSQLGAKSIGSLSNCFVVGQPEDSYGGIFQKDEQLAQLMKRRGGVGIDISTLRPSETHVSNAAKSSTGAVSFMHRYSNTTREVAQSGRRGALMISIDINHPDVLEFIKIKRDLTQVTGANISIKLNKEFMEAVEKGEDYILRFPCDTTTIDTYELDSKEIEYNKLYEVNGKYFKYIKAKEYWDEIIKSAHNVAEPGLMFWDNMVNYSPDGIYPQFKQVTTNPCSEIAMQEYDACRLIVVNLFSFVKNPFTEDAFFDYKEYYKVNYEAMRLSDDLIDLEIEHIHRIIDKIHRDPENEEVKRRELLLWYDILKTAQSSRRTGLGITALGDTLAALGLKYDSEEALLIVDKISKTKMESELDCTIDLAILRGTFEGWDPTKEVKDYNDHIEGTNPFYQMLIENFSEQSERMYHYGRRNVSFSTIAPTGTVSLMTQTTSGIEPLFQPFYIRRKKVNPGEKDVRVDFTDQNGDSWQEFPVLHPKFKDWLIQQNIRVDKEPFDTSELDKAELQYYFEQSPWYGSTANDINWGNRVKLQGVAQKYITHSISSTINLPKDVSEEEVSNIYMEAWKQGLKGITVYRDGSRSGVLVTETTKQDKFGYTEATKRPKTLDAEYYFATSKGKKFGIVIGLYNGNPYEIFAFENPENEVQCKGIITKKKKGCYEFKSNDFVIENLQLSAEHSEEKLLTRWISLLLRHGANPKFVVEQTEKSEIGVTSFVKVLVRILKKYIPEGEKSTVSCQDCGSKEVIFEEGCRRCKDCGSSACG